MKLRLLSCLILTGIASFLSNDVLAVAPNISYTTPQTLSVGSSVSITPTNTGGAVTAGAYGNSSTFASITGTPFSVITDASGNVYSIDESNGNLYKYTSGGTRTTLNGTTLTNPVNIAVEQSTGNIYVSDFGTNKVYKFNSTGGLLATITGFSSPYGIAIDGSGNVYVASNGDGTVKQIPAGTTGTVAATNYITGLTNPYGITFDAAGNMYISSNTASTIRKVAAGSTTSAAFVTAGLNGPRNMNLDASGNIYVADYGSNSIKRISSTGTVTTFYTNGVSSPRDVSFDPSGNMFIANSGTNSIIKASPTGGWYINGILPDGLTFNSSTGAITGTPTTVTPATTYTITAYNSTGNDNTTLTITVAPATPTITGSSSGCAGSLVLTASGGSPSGGTYTWYNSSSGGTALATGATYVVPSSGTYYATYTYNSVESARGSGKAVTVNSLPVLSTVQSVSATSTSAYLAYPFTGNTNDASGNGNNGTVRNSVTLTTDRFNAPNSAYSFDGSTGYISTTTSYASPGPQNFSISVWFNTTTAGGLLVGFGSSQTGSSSNYDRHLYMSNSGQIIFGTYPGTIKMITTNITGGYADGGWHHVVATLSSTNGAKLYVDGALQASDATMTGVQNYGAVGYWRIGYTSDALSGSWTNASSRNYFKGSLDDIGIYKSELTASQVYSLYGAGSAPICAGNALALQANTVSGASYSWTGPNGFTSTAQNPTVNSSAATTDAGTYTVTVTNSSGCSYSEDVTAVVYALPTATFTATSSVDVGNTATVSLSSTYDNTLTYTWNFGTGASLGATTSTSASHGPYSVSWSSAGVKTITLTVTNVNGCSIVVTQNVYVNVATYGSFAYRLPITLNTTSLGISSNLTNFPYLISITDPSLVVSASSCSNKVQFPNGTPYDFAFVDPSGEIPYQVENYDPTTGSLLVWVKLPTLTYNTNNTLSLFFGSNTANTSNTPSSVWASDYQAVYHFNEGTGTIVDATSNGRSAAATNAVAATGQITKGYTFNGSTKIVSAASVPLTSSFTLSAWINVKTSAGNDQKVVTNENSYTAGGAKLGLYGISTSAMYTELETRSSTGAATLTRAPSALGGTVVTSGNWHYVQGVYDASTGKFYTYYDCSATPATYDKTMTGAAAGTSSTNYIYMGSDFAAGNWFNGIMDEVRVSTAAKSADWIKAEFKNQGAPATYTSTGTLVTDFTNASAIQGGITYTTTTGTSFTYTINGTTTTANPPNDGTANIVFAANYNVPVAGNVYGMTINNGYQVDLKGLTFNVGCNVINNGTLTNTSGTASTLTFNGDNATQTYTGTSTSVGKVDNLTINNSSAGTITVSGGTLAVAKTLTVTKGNLVIDNANSGALTLLSTATQSANIATIPAAYSITGKVYVQRYITGNSNSTYRSYRLLSSPVNITSATASATGANYIDLSTLKSSYTLNGTTFYGAYTGGSGTGFSVSNSNPTIYFYKETLASSNFSFTSGKNVGVTSISSGSLTLTDGGSYNMPVGNGYIMYFIGSTNGRTSGSASIVPTNATITNYGYINQGNIPVNLWYTPGGATLNSLKLSYTSTLPTTGYPGYNMVGNPYACTIDLNTVYTDNFNGSSNNINSNFYELYDVNPGQAYVVWSASGGTSSSKASRYVVSGQGFFVRATGTGQTLTFKEDQKVPATQLTAPALLLAAHVKQNLLSDGSYSSMAALPSSADAIAGLHLMLEKDSTTTDECGIYFGNDWKDKSDFDDAPDWDGISPKVYMSSFSSDGVRLALNKLSDYTKGKTVKLYVNATTDGLYAVKLTDVQSIDTALYNVYLRDHYKRDSLDIGRYKTYNFNVIRNDTSSFGANRFELVIKRKDLPAYQLVTFSGQKVESGVQLTWKTYNEDKYTGFTLQRMDGTQQFIPIYELQSDGRGTYTYIDKAPLKGVNSYKLLSNDVNNQNTYSNVVSVILGAGNASEGLLLSVYPNPAASQIQVTISNDNAVVLPKVNLQVRVMSTAGRVVATLKNSGNIASAEVSNLKPGTYVIEAIDTETKKVYGRKVFVKL